MGNIKRIRELVMYLVVLAAKSDPEAAKKFSEELESLLPLDRD